MLFVYALVTFFLGFWIFDWTSHVLAIVYGYYKFRLRRRRVVMPIKKPSVSIIKPLMGEDVNLYHNLETFFHLEYPNYEILFCVEDKSDPAINVVRRLMESYPHIRARLILGGSSCGVNPKINNIQPAFEASKSDLIMISDSGIKMRRDTLTDMVWNMEDDVGLVHQVPYVCDRNLGYPSTVEQVSFGTQQARLYLAGVSLGLVIHTSMSTLIRKSVLDEIEGFKSFGCYLAEDYFLAKYILDKGYKSTISCLPALQNPGVCNVKRFTERIIRWNKLRITMIPPAIIAEPMTEGLVIGIFVAWSFWVLFSINPIGFYLIHSFVWMLADWTLLVIIQNGPLPFNRFEFFTGWVTSELIQPYTFVRALRNFWRIRWRTRTYQIEWGGKAHEIK